ncbi:MAG: hypothetical protein JNL32_10675 [Candidatus Kapabacteria bacterium]|nr:hypothetical protein [Candidatus Kapabacteria bacterium]
MFALPHQTIQSYTYSLNEALALGTEHISAYSLIYEEGTPLYAQLLRNEVTPLDEDTDTRLYELTMHTLTAHGYTQYEVSNFAKNGKRCRHNLAYWSAREYTAFGPSAHGYSDSQRYWNYRNLTRYMDSLRRNQLPVANTETLSSTDTFYERVFLGLRSTGINLHSIQTEFGFDVAALAATELDVWEKEALIENKNGVLTLTQSGYTLCDEITVRLLATIEQKTGIEWQQHEYKENDTDIPLPVLG